MEINIGYMHLFIAVFGFLKHIGESVKGRLGGHALMEPQL